MVIDALAETILPPEPAGDSIAAGAAAAVIDPYTVKPYVQKKGRYIQW